MREAARALRAAGVKAVAVCFLYSFVRPAHEATARRILAEEFPEAFVTASHDVAPEFREYERLSTAVVNAYLGPVMQGYIRRLAERLDDARRHRDAAPDPVQRRGHRLRGGGRHAGAHGALRPLHRRRRRPGGRRGWPGCRTSSPSTWAAPAPTWRCCRAASCRLAGEAIVHGYPIKAPMLDIHTVGAGGGSIAYVDSGGLLKVGPRSAGAAPGPVCYGRGNAEPTVTDANVVLGTLHPTHLLGGRLPVRQDLAVAAIERLAAQLGMER